MVDDEAVEFALDGERSELYRYWLEARTKRLAWEAQEKAAKEQMIELFASTKGKAIVATLDSRPVVRLTRIDYFTLNQAELRKFHPEIYEAYMTKRISYEQLAVLGQDDVELAG